MASILSVKMPDGTWVEIPYFVAIPKRGEDYWTEDDKTEIVKETLAALPIWEGGNY